MNQGSRSEGAKAELEEAGQLPSIASATFWPSTYGGIKRQRQSTHGNIRGVFLLHADDMIPAIDMMRLAGHAG